MIAQSDLPRQISDQLVTVLNKKDPDVQIKVKRTSLGWLQLSVTTSLFDGQTSIEREQLVDEILTTMKLSLGGYPFVDYELRTPQEAAHLWETHAPGRCASPPCLRARRSLLQRCPA